jgi:hypothetical protein
MTTWQFALLQSSIFTAAFMCAPRERAASASACCFVGVAWLAFAILSVVNE